MSITAFPVLLRILADRGMTSTPLGQTAIACAALGDATAWCLLALIVAAAQAQGWVPAALNLVCVVVFVGVMLGLVRPWFSRQVIAAGQEGRWLLVHAADGAGLRTGHRNAGHPCAVWRVRRRRGGLVGRDAARPVVSRVEPFAVTLLLPLFFAMTGLRMRADALQASDLLLCVVVIAVATVGKLFGTWSAARSAGMGNHEAWKLGALMNTRGLMELIVLNLGYELGFLGDRLFAVLVIMALVTTAMTGPLLSLIERR